MPAISGFASLMVLQVMSLEVCLKCPAMTKPTLTVESLTVDVIKEVGHVETDKLFSGKTGKTLSV